jgi:hypothetical protein
MPAMKRSLIALLAVLLASWAALSHPAAAADWKLCSENEFLSLYFDAARPDDGPEEARKVWVKYLPKGKKGKEFWVHIRSLDKIPSAQLQGYAYSVVLYEINCPDRVYRLISGIDYNAENRMLAEMTLSRWKPVFPDSLIETLEQAVCPR